ncbi:AEC family transporter [Clostridium estertheticum]|uniref:AEC family transporter n=1 Tax=Clostridium estertheticum TaxID=238834 RepID=A0AA47EHF4_9CLOT|nr:AEC family transporter [Clostridium estertheticum]MBU3154394.1 AEC family transporter [Clostridium estertheticum]WAG60282.1 AEC family transporter [Clostridium estertheticum]
MNIIIAKAITLMAIILTGYIFKKINILKKQDFEVISSIVLKLTLPCAIIANLNGTKLSLEMLFIIIIGFGFNIFLVIAGYFMRKNKTDKSFSMLNLSGFNIGNFTLPFVSGVFSSTSVLATCMFDAGNSIMCLGMTYGFASAIQDPSNKFDYKIVFKKVVSSVPVCTYMFMIVLSICNILIPSNLIIFAQTIGSANTFLSMLMIGIAIEVHFNKKIISLIWKHIMVRYSICGLLALFIFFMAPISLEMRQTIVILLFSPITSLATVYTQKLGGNTELSACINSISIIFSVIIITVLILLFS